LGFELLGLRIKLIFHVGMNFVMERMGESSCGQCREREREKSFGVCVDLRKKLGNEGKKTDREERENGNSKKNLIFKLNGEKNKEFDVVDIKK
jgi:hypothetical protein